MSTAKATTTGILNAPDNIVRRFLKRLAKCSVQQGDCIVWTGPKCGRPSHLYGITRINMRVCRVSRVIYEYTYKISLQDKEIVRHKCDNTLCINPEHLETGSLADNARDMVDRGRMFHPDISGIRHFNTDLTEQDVIQIRLLRKQGETLKSLGLKFNLSISQVCGICKGREWKHIPL